MNKRLRVFLTNSLEEADETVPDLFTAALAREAAEANEVKRNTPVMVVLGNPPYSGISKNNGEWISRQIDDYKYVDGEYFNERKHWLNDDYVKFIRTAEHYIARYGEGVMAFINNHSFLDNPTFRGMRWHLMKTYDKIYIIDLHGNGIKKETTPEGDKDENVFDIQAGVSINLFVKNGNKTKGELAEVLHYDLWGRRTDKYEYLSNGSLFSCDFKKIANSNPNYFFVPKDNSLLDGYSNGISIEDLMPVQSMGITSARDFLVVDIDRSELKDRIEEFGNSNIADGELREKYFGNKKDGKYLKGDTRGWRLSDARKIVDSENVGALIQPISFRPFDVRYMYYSKSMVDWDRLEVMQHLLQKNFAFCTVRLGRNAEFHNYQIANHIVDKGVCSSLDNSNIFPLYLYPDQGQLSTDGEGIRPNIDEKLAKQLAVAIGCDYVFDEARAWEHGKQGEVLPLDILDYTYAVLHSPAYREKYKEFLKIDFPRIPYCTDEGRFRALVKLGAELRQVHLLEHPKLEQFRHLIKFPMVGDNTVTRKMTANSPGFESHEMGEHFAELVGQRYEHGELPEHADAWGRVYINDTQYFDSVGRHEWEFYIGGYQPAQKWLKDRQGRQLSFDDIVHYQKMITALGLTQELMRKVDNVGVV